MSDHPEIEEEPHSEAETELFWAISDVIADQMPKGRLYLAAALIQLLRTKGWRGPIR